MCSARSRGDKWEAKTVRGNGTYWLDLSRVLAAFKVLVNNYQKRQRKTRARLTGGTYFSDINMDSLFMCSDVGNDKNTFLEKC